MMLHLLSLALAAIQLEQLLPHPHFEVRESGVLPENANIEIFYKGKLVQCHVPDQDSWQLASPPAEPTREQILEAQKLIEQERDCAYWMDAYSYWGYRLCHNDTVRQIHPKQDGDNFIFSDKFIGYNLGNRTSTVSAELRDGLWHYKALYDSGTTCDLTGSERSTDVFYYCDPDVTKDTIKHVRETHICVYEVIVASPHICNVFENPVDAVNYIECYNPDFLAEQAELENQAKEALREADEFLDQLFEGLYELHGEIPQESDENVKEKYKEWLERTGRTANPALEHESAGHEHGQEIRADELPILIGIEELKEMVRRAAELEAAADEAADSAVEPDEGESRADLPDKEPATEQIEHSEL